MELRSERTTRSIPVSGNQPLVGERRTEPDVQVLTSAQTAGRLKLNGADTNAGVNNNHTCCEPAALNNPYLQGRTKRIFDIFLSLFMLPFAIPAAILCWLLVMITMGFPAIFAQHRVGLNGKVFVMFKFRSLKRTSNTRNGTSHSNADITPVGRFLRMFRLDELPQVYNILRGEMSWVGPRPEVPYYVELFSDKNPDFMLRHKALPGITGMAQVRNPNATPNDNLEKMQYDLEYIRRASLQTDLKILMQTFLVIINR